MNRKKKCGKYLGLTIGNLKLDGHTETLPLLGALDDVITNLLGGHTEGTELGGKHLLFTDTKWNWNMKF